MKAVIAALALILALEVNLHAGRQDNYGWVEGRVLRYGTQNGLANVDITVAPQGATGQIQAETATDSDGKFVLRSLAPGAYTIRARRTGWVNPAPSGVRVESGGTTRSVVLAPGQRVDADLSMEFGGVITGRILDPAGKPLVGTTVSALATTERGNTAAPSTQTNDRGEYRIFGLESGAYRMSIAGGTSFGTVYFPGVADVSQAETLTVIAGGILNDIEVRMGSALKTFKVSGSLVSAEGKLEDTWVEVFYLVPRDARRPNPKEATTNGGFFAVFRTNNLLFNLGDSTARPFEISSIRPGAYDLFVQASNRKSPDDCCDIAGRVPLQVGAQDIQNLTVRAEAGEEIRGYVVVTGNPAQHPGATISLAMVPEDIRTRRVKSDPTGAFTIPAVSSGTWKVLVSDLPSNIAVFEVRSGQRIIQNDLVVDGRTQDPLQIVLTAAGAVEGIVRDAERRPLAGAHVVLIPNPPNESRHPLYRKTTTDAAGRFSLAAVAVGSYSAFALEPSINAESVPVDLPALRTFLVPYEPRRLTLVVQAGQPATAELTTGN